MEENQTNYNIGTDERCAHILGGQVFRACFFFFFFLASRTVHEIPESKLCEREYIGEYECGASGAPVGYFLSIFFFAFVLLCGNECEGINKNDLYYHYVDNVLLTVLMVCGSDLVNGVMDSGEFQGIDVAQGPGWLTLALHTETGTRKYELSHKCELGSTAKRNSFRRHPNYKLGIWYEGI